MVIYTVLETTLQGLRFGCYLDFFHWEGEKDILS